MLGRRLRSRTPAGRRRGPHARRRCPPRDPLLPHPRPPLLVSARHVESRRPASIGAPPRRERRRGRRVRRRRPPAGARPTPPPPAFRPSSARREWSGESGRTRPHAADSHRVRSAPLVAPSRGRRARSRARRSDRSSISSLTIIPACRRRSRRRLRNSARGRNR